MKYLISIIVLATISIAQADRRSDIEQRIKPIGQVRLKGDDSTKVNNAKAEVKATKVLSGEDVYNKYCMVCHAAGVAGAPKINDEAMWASRQKKGIAHMLKRAIKGINAMPPKGTCMTCSDAELKSAIEYMLPKK